MAIAGIAGLRLIAASIVVFLGALALLPGVLLDHWNAAGILLLLLLCVATVPNVLVHAVRRLEVHHGGRRAVVWLTWRTGEAQLRQRLATAFPGVKGGAIEGLEAPRTSGVTYPLSVVTAALDTLLTSDCTLQLLRSYDGPLRFSWTSLQPSHVRGTKTTSEFRACLAANGFCLVSLPAEKVSPCARLFDEAGVFFQRPVAEKKVRLHLIIIQLTLL
eukprot:SAG11_NODE_1533_length_4732_cov_3.368012_5_plen_217_part_00